MKAILGKKILMTRIFLKDGRQIPVTLVKLENNVITQIKTQGKDGYRAVQVGAGQKRKSHKAQKKSDFEVLYEVKTSRDYSLGQVLNIDQFKEDEKVNVSSVSKGKGFSGTVKRHNFSLGPKTHGSHNWRRPGSIGATYPERVVKGRRMAGRLGGQRTTVKNLKIAKIDQNHQEIMLRGAIPGPKNSPVLIWSQDEN